VDGMTDDKISIPRPRPDQYVIAITDADGATAWTAGSKAHLAEWADLWPQMLAILEEGQQRVHEQRAQATA